VFDRGEDPCPVFDDALLQFDERGNPAASGSGDPPSASSLTLLVSASLLWLEDHTR